MPSWRFYIQVTFRHLHIRTIIVSYIVYACVKLEIKRNEYCGSRFCQGEKYKQRGENRDCTKSAKEARSSHLLRYYLLSLKSLQIQSKIL